jgi:hypothetical protein
MERMLKTLEENFKSQLVELQQKTALQETQLQEAKAKEQEL